MDSECLVCKEFFVELEILVKEFLCGYIMYVMCFIMYMWYYYMCFLCWKLFGDFFMYFRMFDVILADESDDSVLEVLWGKM